MGRVNHRQGEAERVPGGMDRLLRGIRPLTAPLDGPGRGPTVCPHCWMVNPAAFRLCSRCGASMESHLQESAGLRRTAPVQSPVPSGVRLSPLQRVIVAAFLLALALTYLAQLLPVARRVEAEAPAPVSSGS